MDLAALSGFTAGFAGTLAAGNQQRQAEKARRQQMELAAISHLMDKPDLDENTKNGLGQRYIGIIDEMGGPRAKGLVARLLGHHEKQPLQQNGTFSSDSALQAADADASAGTLPPVPGALEGVATPGEDYGKYSAPAAKESAPPLPGLMGVGVPGMGYEGAATPSAAAGPTPSMPAQSEQRSIPPVPTQVGSSGMFRGKNAKLQDEVTRKEALEGVTTREMVTRGKNATTQRVDLEKQLEPLREKQRQAAEASAQARQVAVEKARAENRMVKAGIGPKAGGMPWDYVSTTVYGDGSIVEAPANPPPVTQSILQIAQSRAQTSGKPLLEEWNNLMQTKGKQEDAKAKGAEARATQTDMRNKGTLPPIPRAAPAGPTSKNFQGIEDKKNAGWKKSDDDWAAENIKIDSNRNLTTDQKKNLKAQNDAKRTQSHSNLQTGYERSIQTLKGGSTGGAPQQKYTEQQVRERAKALGKDENSAVEAARKANLIQ